MRSYRYLHLDVFTDRLFGGNQLAVFLDGRGLAPDTMQSIAKEMSFSETTFVLPSSRPEADFEVRIFTPDTELPMAGHPTIGTAFALARAGVLSPGRDRVTFGLGIGPTLVSLVWREGTLSFAWMTQLRPSFGAPILDRAGAATVLRLSPAAVAGSGLPVQTVSCGVPFLFVPLATRHAVDNAALDATAYDGFRGTTGLDELPVFLFSPESANDKADAYSRVFAPGLGIAEDAATGGASGALGCYLLQHKVVPLERAGSIMSLQGVKMGRPSRVHIAIGATNGEIDHVRVGGESVIAGEGTLYL